MSEEAPQLKRDSTMVVTAREGEAFLESCGKIDEDAKTRGQQKEIDAITEEVSPSKLKRATTMEVTASEGAELLAGEELGKTRSESNREQEEPSEENGADENGHAEKDEEKPSLQRVGTMQVTAEEGTQFLEKQGHTTDARTRGEAAAENENGDEKSEETAESAEETEPTEKAPAPLKRTHTMAETVKEGEEFLKRQKTDDDTNAETAKETEEQEEMKEDEEEKAEETASETKEEVAA